MPERAPDFVYTIFIAASADKVWDALTDGEMTRAYWGHDNVSDWKPGSRWEHVRIGAEGRVDIVGKVIEIDPPRRLVVSWASPGEESDPAQVSRVTYAVAALDSETRLTVTHADLAPGSEMQRGVTQGWPMVLSSLKSCLETGRGLEMVRQRVKRAD